MVGLFFLLHNIPRILMQVQILFVEVSFIKLIIWPGFLYTCIKQLLDEVEHDIVNYQNRGLCYNTDTRF